MVGPSAGWVGALQAGRYFRKPAVAGDQLLLAGAQRREGGCPSNTGCPAASRRRRHPNLLGWHRVGARPRWGCPSRLPRLLCAKPTQPTVPVRLHERSSGGWGVAPGRPLRTARQHVAGLLVGAIANVGHRHAIALELPPHPRVNALGPPPARLQQGRQGHRRHAMSMLKPTPPSPHPSSTPSAAGCHATLPGPPSRGGSGRSGAS